jgi:hypothetical protein
MSSNRWKQISHSEKRLSLVSVALFGDYINIYNDKTWTRNTQDITLVKYLIWGYGGSKGQDYGLLECSDM